MGLPADIVRVDVDVNYGPDATPDTLVNPLIEAFILRTADMVKNQQVITYAGVHYNIKLDNHADVDYVILQHMLPLPVAPDDVSAPVDVLWVDDTSGDAAATQLNNAETMIIPNPLKYDATLGFGGIQLYTLEAAGVAINVIAVGKKT